MKKLYSFRADVSALDALREESDSKGVTVTELIHEYIYDGLRRAGRDVRANTVNPIDGNTLACTSSENMPDTVDSLNTLFKQQYASSPSLNSIEKVMDIKIQKLSLELKQNLRAEFEDAINELKEKLSCNNNQPPTSQFHKRKT